MLLLMIYLTILIILFALGGYIGYRFASVGKWSHRLLAFSSGFLLTLTFMKIIPKGTSINPKLFGVGLVLAYVIMIFMEHFLRVSFEGGHGHLEHSSEHPGDQHQERRPSEEFILTSSMTPCEPGVSCPIEITDEERLWTLSAVLAFALHNFADGVGLASGFLKGVNLKLFTFLAILLHKIPAGMGLGAVLGKVKISLNNFMKYIGVIALASILGALVTFYLGNLLSIGSRAMILGFAGGSFIYLGATHMLPEAHTENDRYCFLIFLLGILAYIPLELLVR